MGQTELVGEFDRFGRTPVIRALRDVELPDTTVGGSPIRTFELQTGLTHS